MNTAQVVASILAIGLGTFAFRFSFIWLGDRITLPAYATQALLYVPVAVFSALVLPTLLMQQGQLDPSAAAPRCGAALIAGLVAYKTKNISVTLVVGMVALHLFR